MESANANRTRGSIIKVPDATPGILFANGQQQYFTLERVWKSPTAPAVNQNVDVEFDATGALTAITVVDQQQSSQFNKERLNQLGGVAQEQGKQAAHLAKQGVGALAARMGALPLGAAVLLWIAWFFFPAAAMSGGMVGSISFTFWGLLGLDFNNPASAMGGGSDHGLFAMIGLIAIVAPFVAPFIRTPWSRYLNAAPIAYILIGWIAIYMNENKAFGELGKMMGGSPFSFSWGLYVLVIIALVLGAGALKKPAA
jgi:hypothetical protein